MIVSESPQVYKPFTINNNVTISSLGINFNNYDITNGIPKSDIHSCPGTRPSAEILRRRKRKFRPCFDISTYWFSLRRCMVCKSPISFLSLPGEVQACLQSKSGRVGPTTLLRSRKIYYNSSIRPRLRSHGKRRYSINK